MTWHRQSYICARVLKQENEHKVRLGTFTASIVYTSPSINPLSNSLHTHF